MRTFKQWKYDARAGLCEAIVALAVKVMPDHYLPVIATEALADGIKIGRQNERDQNGPPYLKDRIDWADPDAYPTATQEELDAIQSAISGDYGPTEEGWPQRPEWLKHGPIR